MDEITIGEKTYISSKQAAKITGYAKDYIGQLCREGRVEARLVGRNWYVLDSAIREHRFGKKEEEAAPAPEILQAEETLDRSSTWKKPQYEAEIPVLVPSFSGKAAETVGAPAIADMQSAWKEWFQDKQVVQEDVLPNLSTMQEEEQQPSAAELPEEESETVYEEEIVTVSRIQYTEAPSAQEEEVADEPSSETVDIQRIYSPKPVQVARPLDRTPAQPPVARRSTQRPISKSEKRTGTLVVRSLLIVVSVAVALVAMIGTGHADAYLAGTSLDFGVQKQVLDFLGGKSVYESTL